MSSIRNQINKMREHKLALSPWEQGFSESIEQQYHQRGRLSESERDRRANCRKDRQVERSR
mgnify:CR=1 FL=1